jgi:hypothetical protein
VCPLIHGHRRFSSFSVDEKSASRYQPLDLLTDHRPILHKTSAKPLRSLSDAKSDFLLLPRTADTIVIADSRPKSKFWPEKVSGDRAIVFTDL